MKAIYTIDELRQSCQRGNSEFVVRLNHGAISRKAIFPRKDGGFSVFHDIDGTFERLSAQELCAESIVGDAMVRGGLFEAE